MRAMLEKIDNHIKNAHDEVILWKRWDIKRASNEFAEAMSRMYPFTHKYYFEANPSYICDYKNLLDMQRQPVIMLQDGVINLTAFFAQNYRVPPNFKTILLINKRFESVIPPSWKDYVATYEIEYPKLDKQDIKKIYVYGMLVSYSFWFQSPKEILDELDKKISKNVEIEFMLPIRERSFFITQDETKYVTPFLEELYERYGKRMTLHTNYDQLLNVQIKKGSAFCELVDTPYIFGDNYMSHVFSHNDCYMINPPHVDKKDALVYPLSLNHNVIIKDFDKSKSKFNEFMVEVKSQRVDPSPIARKYHMFIKDCIEKGLLKV